MSQAKLVVILLLCSSLCNAQEVDTETRYVRLQEVDEKPQSLQTSIVRFGGEREGKQVAVDLVAAIHIGDRAYYKRLNEQFEEYDVVLYELVAPEGMERPTREGSDNPLRLIHGMMQSVLGLSSQLDEVNYNARNFVHADMSPAEMSEALRERGDTPLTFALTAFADVLRQANNEAQELELESEHPTISQQDVLSFLTGEGGADLKRKMAEQLSRVGSSSTPLGPTLGQLLVSDRNEAALEVLKDELAKGRRRIAIFYGAAHMPDFQRRLENEFGMELQEQAWLKAWDLSDNSSSKPQSPLNAILELLQSQ